MARSRLDTRCLLARQVTRGMSHLKLRLPPIHHVSPTRLTNLDRTLSNTVKTQTSATMTDNLEMVMMEPPATSHQAQTTRAHLLGLPIEIRRNIYDIIIGFQVSHYCFDFIIESSRWWREKPLKLPVADLAMSCSLLATEIRDHLRSLPVSERTAVVALTGETSFPMPNLCFKRAPCPVVGLKALDVVLDLGVQQHYTHGSSLIPARDPFVSSQLLTSAHDVMRQLQILFDPASSFGKDTSALTEVRIHIRIRGSCEISQTEQDFNTLLQVACASFKAKLTADCLSKANYARVVRIEEVGGSLWYHKEAESTKAQ